MKVLIINGSPHSAGSTYTALHEMEQVFEKNGIETELLQVGAMAIRGCIGCGYCYKNKKCTFDDLVNEIGHKGFVPTKYAACDTNPGFRGWISGDMYTTGSSIPNFKELVEKALTQVIDVFADCFLTSKKVDEEFQVPSYHIEGNGKVVYHFH